MRHALLTAAVSAASLTASLSAVPVQAADDLWSGAYVGLTASGTYTTSRRDDIDYVWGYESSIHNDFGADVGGRAGYNWMFGNALLGLETSYDYSSARSHLNSAPSPFGAAVSNYDNAEISHIFSLRARAGFFPTEDTLIYGTAGPAMARISSYWEMSDADEHDVWESDGYRPGVLTGLGGEFALTDTVHLTGEYFHGFFAGNTVTPSICTGAGCTNEENSRMRFTSSIDTIRLGANYKF